MIKLPSRAATGLVANIPISRAPLLSNVPRSQTQTRTFFDSLLNSALGSCPQRHVTHTKKIPYSSSAVFKAVSDVSGYPGFLPFTISSHVTSRDTAGYPTSAKLKVGYDKFGLEENWDSVVRCDPDKGTIEAKSSENNSGGLFEILSTKWQIGTSGQDAAGKETLVRLDVEVKFRNPLYDQMFAGVEGKVASTMISAFEKRVKEIEATKP